MITCDEVKSLANVHPKALSAAERSDLAEHLNVCPPCRAEYAEIRRVCDALLAAVSIHAPVPRVRQMLAARLAQQKSLHVATVTSARLAPQTTLRPTLWQRVYTWLFGAGIQLSRGGAMACAVLCAALLTGIVWQQTLLNQQSAWQQAETDKQQRVLALLNNPQTKQVGLTGVGDAAVAIANLRYDPTSNTGVLLIRDLPVLPADKNYQLWMVYGDGLRDTGAVFACVPSTETLHTFLIDAPRQFNTYIRFGVTIEPAGGSPSPTGPRAFSSAL